MGPETGFLPNLRATTRIFVKKTAWGPETGFLPNLRATTRIFVKKPGFFGWSAETRFLYFCSLGDRL
ncbi:MAG TPA: hypothetical protein DCS91_12935 [Microcoleaceae bacterium UBA11344]|nr:hypothetical protein [Microcoleaceae cyanobacterium UBA11344]